METEKCRLNQFGNTDDVSNMSVDDWEDKWKLGQTLWHMPQVHPILDKYFSKLTNDRKNLRFYLPLCGKTVDIKWLADKGYEVVGSDGSDVACQDFFKDNSMEYTREDLPEITGGGVLYQNKEKTIKLYKCDYFKLPPELVGQVDCIWDRGSYAAIPVTERQRYIDLILASLKPDGKYLLDAFLLPHDKYQGPPFNSSEEELRQYVGSRCNIEKLEAVPFEKLTSKFDLDYCIETVYLLTFKN